MSDEGGIWDGDLLGRAKEAAWLSQLVVAETQRLATLGEVRSLCLAVDGDWGAGKTFFMRRWARELRASGAPVVEFDAWANDLAEDPLVAFIAEFKRQLKPLASTRHAAKQGLEEIVKRAGRAAMPAGAVIGKALLKKGTGIELSDLAEAGGEAMEKAFSAATAAHAAKRDTIKELKKRLTGLSVALRGESGASAPIYVLIDELDRCRPDYAVRLLEGIKHLFDAEGICYALSTNLAQLGAAVAGIYGAAFDGRRYLRRFFDFEYMLGEPDLNAYAGKLVAGSALLRRVFRAGTLSHWENSQQEAEARLRSDFAAVSRILGLDLRTQAQVFRRAEAAAAGIPKSPPLHTFLLFFLTAALAVSPSAFERLLSADLETRARGLSELPIAGGFIKVMDQTLDGPEESRVAYARVIAECLRLMHVSRTDIFKSVNQTVSSPRYPNDLESSLLQGGVVRDDLSPLANYGKTIRAAGRVEFTGAE